jgi:MFS family permease
LSRKSIEHANHKPGQSLTRIKISLYLAQFVESLFSAVQSNLNPYITSSFGEHGLTAVVSIVASITGGVCNLFVAKILDIWGRVEGFFCMLLLIVVGSIMKAACHNIETYAAANTIYWVSGEHGTSCISLRSC